MGGNKVFEIDENLINGLDWFNDEIYAELSVDFFHKKSVAYNKKSKSVKAGDLF